MGAHESFFFNCQLLCNHFRVRKCVFHECKCLSVWLVCLSVCLSVYVYDAYMLMEVLRHFHITSPHPDMMTNWVLARIRFHPCIGVRHQGDPDCRACKHEGHSCDAAQRTPAAHRSCLAKCLSRWWPPLSSVAFRSGGIHAKTESREPDPPPPNWKCLLLFLAMGGSQKTQGAIFFY